MKKMYEIPKIEFVDRTVKDVITTSGVGLNIGGEFKDDNGSIKWSDWF